VLESAVHSQSTAKHSNAVGDRCRRHAMRVPSHVLLIAQRHIKWSSQAVLASWQEERTDGGSSCSRPRAIFRCVVPVLPVWRVLRALLHLLHLPTILSPIQPTPRILPYLPTKSSLSSQSSGLSTPHTGFAKEHNLCILSRLSKSISILEF
jgi:hypothetical protein